MIKNGKGGGNTHTGLIFEGKTDLGTFLSKQDGYTVDNSFVYYKGEEVARLFKKNNFYRFLEEIGIDWEAKISKKLLPDDSIYVIINNTMFIIECKFQQVEGSVDEKLQTCDFKKKQYQKLLYDANIEVEYIYILSDWFKKPKYQDVLDYIISVRCQYYFEYIPLSKLGLPMPHNEDCTFEKELISSNNDIHDGYGAGSGDIERYEYYCPCKKGKIIEEHDNIPGFRDHSVFMCCTECNDKYVIDTERGVRNWKVKKI